MTHSALRLLLMIVLAAWAVIASAEGSDGKEKKDEISNYLVDIGAAPVSAANMIGVTGSAVANIQTARDLTVILSPLTSGPGQGGFGIAITPARTTLFPMSGKAYVDSRMMRFLGALTLSYATNTSSIGGVSYQKQAVSLDGGYYWNKEDDPVFREAQVFNNCEERKRAERALLDYRHSHAKPDPSEEKKLSQAANAALDACQNADAAARKKAGWNATKFGISAGNAWIKPDSTAGATNSLGNTYLFAGVIRTGENGATYFTVRRVIGELDLNTLATRPAFSDSTLAGIRYTYGLESDDTVRVLAEVSNTKSKASTATVSGGAFKYAIGFDKKLADGIWAEFRAGRARTTDGTDTQNAALLNLNWSPKSTLSQ